MCVVRMGLGPAMVQTWYTPDEHWQGPEIAHRLVYGYGHATWEWGEAALRSYVHPLLIALPLYVVKELGWDSPKVVVYTPRIVHGACQVVTDVFTLLILSAAAAAAAPGGGSSSAAAPGGGSSSAVAPDRESSSAGTERRREMGLWVVLFSWYSFYVSSRPLASVAASGPIAFVLYVWTSIHPSLWSASWEGLPEGKKTWVAWRVAGVGMGMGISVMLRPTSGVVFAALVAAGVWDVGVTRRGGMSRVWGSVLGVMGVRVLGPMALGWVGVAVGLDSWMYGAETWVCVPWNFVRFNVGSGVSEFYGTHPWHWYVTAGIPTLLGPWIIPYVLSFVVGNERCGWVGWVADVVVGVVVGVYSGLAHKEERFLYPLMPLLLIRVARGVRVMWEGRRGGRWVVVGLAVVGVGMVGYVGGVHQRGVMDMAWEMQRMVHEEEGNVEGIFFLTPCHATPYYAFVGSESVRLGFLDCSPPFHLEAYQERGELDFEGYVDQAERFFRDPVGFLRDREEVEGTTLDEADVVVAFSSVEEGLGEYLGEKRGCWEVGRWFHSHVGVDRGVQSEVVAWRCRE